MTGTRRALIRRALLAAPLVLTAVVLGMAAPAAATPAAPVDVDDDRYDPDDFEFESMHVDFTLGRDEAGRSTLHAVETIVALFPDFDQNRGIVRDIPTEYQRVDIGVDVLGVTDGNGNAVPFEETRWTDDDADGTDFVSLALGTDEFVHGRTTYVIEWTAVDVIGVFRDTDAQEFYWDVNGNGWAQTFREVSADVRLEPELVDALNGNSACYRGWYGTDARCDIAETDDGFSVAETDLLSGEGVTVAIGFEPGTFAPGIPIDRHWIVTILPWVLLAVLAALIVGVVVLRRAVWRHAPGRGIIVPQYEAPEGIGVMGAAELVGRPQAGLPAQLVHLAVQDIARLVEDPDRPEESRFRLELVDLAAATDRDDDTAIRKLFGKSKARNGETLVLDRNNRKLGDRIASLNSQMRAEVRTRGFLARPKSGLKRLIFWPAFAVLLAGIGILVFCGMHDVGNGLLSIQMVVIIPTALMVIGFSGPPERRTDRGAEVYEHLLGLRDYLRLAEEDRLRVLQSPQGAVRERIDPADDVAVVKLYEKLLPWAIVWGVEREWADVIGRRYAETPPPSSNLNFATSASIASIGSTLQSSGFSRTQTSSSGSGGGSSFSGSSGGGFSGGGGGGGGGGGR